MPDGEHDMKVVLIFPNFLESNLIIQSSFTQNLGIAMIAAVLRDAGHDVRVVDATAERLNMPSLERRLRELDPAIIGITANVSFARKAFITGKWLRRKFPRARVLFGGPWPTIDHEYLLLNDAADVVVIGEGERTVVELLDAISDGRSCNEVAGIAFIEGNRVVKTPPRPYIEDLDALPMPAWDLFPAHKQYFTLSKGKRFFPVCTSRGCTLGCIQCSKMVHGYKIRERSIGNVIAELRYLKERFSMDEISFIDDFFNHDIERVENLCRQIIQLDFRFSIAFVHGIRADMVTPRMASLLRQAGAYDVAFGIESGNQDVVTKLGKNLDLNVVRRSVKIFKKLGYFTRGFFMIGLPWDNIHTLVDTKVFARELGLDVPHFFKVVPFPGTRLYTIIQERGRFLIDMHDNLSFYHYTTPTHEIQGLPSELIDLAMRDLNRSLFLRFEGFSRLVRRVRISNLRWFLNSFLVIMRSLKARGPRHDPEAIKRRIKEKIKQDASLGT